jgi:hypothetical protein
MGDIKHCLPYAMERELRQMQREGWRIVSVNRKTRCVLATIYGNGVAFSWDEVEQTLKRLGPNESGFVTRESSS